MKMANLGIADPATDIETERNWDIDLTGLPETEVFYTEPGRLEYFDGVFLDSALNQEKESVMLDSLKRPDYIT